MNKSINNNNLRDIMHKTKILESKLQTLRYSWQMI